MKALWQSDIRRRYSFIRFEYRWVWVRSVTRSQLINSKLFSQVYSKFPVNISNKGRVRNRCKNTGRSGSILSRFKVSRLSFRWLADRGKLLGVSRSSW